MLGTLIPVVLASTLWAQSLSARDPDLAMPRAPKVGFEACSPTPAPDCAYTPPLLRFLPLDLDRQALRAEFDHRPEQTGRRSIERLEIVSMRSPIMPGIVLDWTGAHEPLGRLRLSELAGLPEPVTPNIHGLEASDWQQVWLIYAVSMPIASRGSRTSDGLLLHDGLTPLAARRAAGFTDPSAADLEAAMQAYPQHLATVWQTHHTEVSAAAATRSAAHAKEELRLRGLNDQEGARATWWKGASGLLAGLLAALIGTTLFRARRERQPLEVVITQDAVHLGEQRLPVTDVDKLHVEERELCLHLFDGTVLRRGPYLLPEEEVSEMMAAFAQIKLTETEAEADRALGRRARKETAELIGRD